MPRKKALKVVPADDPGAKDREEVRLQKHREAVRKGSAARKAAVERLINQHRVEFAGYLEEEKELRGIRSWGARRKDKAEAQLVKLLTEHPDLVAALQRNAS